MAGCGQDMGCVLLRADHICRQNAYKPNGICCAGRTPDRLNRNMLCRQKAGQTELKCYAGRIPESEGI